MADATFTPGASGAPGRVIIIEGETFLFDTPLLKWPLGRVPQAVGGAGAANLNDSMLSEAKPAWDHVLASQDSFNTLMADKASLGYASFADPAYSSRRGHSAALATSQHDRKLHASYSRLVSAIAELYGPGLTAFQDAVTHARPTYRKGAALPLSLTGAYLTTIIECAVRQWWWVSSNVKLRRYRNALDHIEGDWPP